MTDEFQQPSVPDRMRRSMVDALWGKNIVPLSDREVRRLIDGLYRPEVTTPTGSVICVRNGNSYAEYSLSSRDVVTRWNYYVCTYMGAPKESNEQTT